MKAHVQNPWSKSPQLFVHMTVEEVQQLRSALRLAHGCAYYPNERAAFSELVRTLEHAFQTPLPRGIKGVMP